ncbi:MAG: VOC family protein [Vicinamibacterales bacterium]|jgi:catechol 2,3-dioxygenase-like lactoylglutathione lyase family enzyme|nr:VOC family protein [Vicinamibacterales bacterium]HJN44909.1 VOC family protein [Vicinamibacterales bacterium]
MNRTRIGHSLVVAAVSLIVMPAMVLAADYHHVHVTASNATEAVNWYSQYMDCQPLADRDDGVDCGGAQVVFDSRPSLGTSQRTGIDHISFSYADLTAKMADLEAVGVRGSGVRLQRFEDGSTLRDAPGLFKYGFVFDPWGTRIEMVEDADTLGFHHIHLSATDPAATLAWYQEMFGGESARLRDRLDGVLLGDIWLLAMRHEAGTPASTAGRAIDHIAFSVDNLDAAAADMRRNGVEFLEGPAVPEGGRTSARLGVIAGPDNVSLAVVEAGFAGVVSELSTADITTDLQPYTVSRTPWGTPDFQGVWTGDAAHGIPLERPRDLADVEVLSPEQAAARRERGTLGSIWGYESEWRDTTLGYVKSAPSRQVAMVIDPPDGRIPDLTPRGKELRAAARAARRPLAEGPEDLSSWVRCITRSLVQTPGVYNNGFQIVQGPGHVAMQVEMLHETRVIPTDSRPHLGSDISSWRGDARGHWEGDTLVVDITNFNGRVSYQGSSDTLTMTERYTRTGPDTLEYQFTIDDPTVWTRPWTGKFTYVRDDTQYELVEYACHEGNYGMTNILSGARSREADESR